MYVIFLTLPEKDVLKHYSQESPIKQIRLQAQTILMRDRGIAVSDIAAIVFRSERTISEWLKRFAKTRLASIFSKQANNENAAKLTREQKKEIKWLLSQPPDEYGVPTIFWNVPKLKKYVKAVFDVVYESDASYHLLLKFSGLSFKYPDKLSPRRDEQTIKKRMKEIKKEIRPLLKNENWVVFTSDETRLQLEAEIRRAWLVKGKRTIVKTERSKEHQNYLGFLDQKTGVCQIFSIERGNQTETIRVLKLLMAKYPNQKVCVIWDNARWHKGKALRAELAKKKQLKNLHLINMPPYAPDHNPIEHIWGYAKAKLANKADRTLEEIKQEFMQLTNQKTFLYQI